MKQVRLDPLPTPEEDDAYVCVVEEFQEWCELQQSPFKVEAAAAMRERMNREKGKNEHGKR